MSWFTKRMTPSMVVSCIALLVSLGGLGIAATRLPANSVGTKQLAPNSVTSPKVKNGSLRSSDFATGQLPAGPAGPKGDKGDKGDRGEIGPSDGLVDTTKGPVSFTALTNARVATLRLPGKGAYVIWSKALLRRPTAGQPTEFYCTLTANGESDYTASAAPTGLAEMIANGLAVDVTDAETVNLNCTGTGAGTASEAVITAIKVGTLTKSTG
jgi:hypothetical protein